MPQLTFEGSRLHEDVLNQGFALVSHDIPSEAIDELVAAYAAFTDGLPDPSLELMSRMLPDEADPEKLGHLLDELDQSQDTGGEWHKYRTNHLLPPYHKPGGYTNRSLATEALLAVRGVRLKDDPKEYYHYHPQAYGALRAMHRDRGWGPIPPEVGALHGKFQVVRQMASTAIWRISRELEENHPELCDRMMTPRNVEFSPMRLIFYHPGQGPMLAGGHYDKSLNTLQIAESHEGLRVRDPSRADEPWDGPAEDDPRMQLLVRPPDQGVFFQGKLWTAPDAFPHSPHQPGWHDVVNLPTPNEGRILHGRNCARWSLIWFTRSEATISKAEAHSEQAVVSVA